MEKKKNGFGFMVTHQTDREKKFGRYAYYGIITDQISN